MMDKHKNLEQGELPERLTVQGPPYDDVVPFAKKIVESFPDRVLWGTDWPHPNMTKEAPDDGVLVDVIPKIAPTAALQQKLLVDNPMRFYWTDEITAVTLRCEAQSAEPRRVAAVILRGPASPGTSG
jgi:2-pyrone-4,6-dicarboxylate lactonase